MSPNSFEFELICFQRWFIINEFIKAQNKLNSGKIEGFFCCDSDNLVYSDLDEIARTRLGGKTISVTNGICPNCTYFSPDSLDFFCGYITEQYSSSENMQRLESLYKVKLEKKIGGICDMTMFGLLETDKPGLVHDFGRVQKNSGGGYDHVFDNQIHSRGWLGVTFKMSHSLKKIHFENKMPVGTYFDKDGAKKKVVFDVLHFTANSKHYMGRFSFVDFKTKFIFAVKNFSFKFLLKDITPTWAADIFRSAKKKIRS